MTFTPTHEQILCVKAAAETSNNLIISALAGAAKTSTLVLITEALPKETILCLAFNKKIQLEMEQRLPSNVTSRTLNGLGHRIWADTIGRRLELNKDKTFGYLKSKIDEYPTGDDKTHLYENMGDILRAIRGGKSCGYVPDGVYPSAKRLMDDDEFYNWLDEEPSDLMWETILDVTKHSLKQAWAGVIDFDDQVLMPTVFGGMFPAFPLVLVDEAQDLSALNHAMLNKLVRKRLIAVGDECQAIYGFRGAHENSMHLLKQSFSMTQLTLSTSFRCPTSIVEEARWRAPHMQWPEWAKLGEVRHWDKWSVDDLPVDTAMICRNNAPLFRMAIRLLKNGRAAELMGNDIRAMLIKIMKKLGSEEITREQAVVGLNTWKEKKLAKTRSPGSIEDQYECIMLFLNEGRTLREAIAYATRIFSLTGPVKLMTGHKAKGLEFPNVFILDRDLIRMKEPQDRNLLYVMQTRAKETLTYLTTDGLDMDDTQSV